MKYLNNQSLPINKQSIFIYVKLLINLIKINIKMLDQVLDIFLHLYHTPHFLHHLGLTSKSIHHQISSFNNTYQYEEAWIEQYIPRLSPIDEQFQKLHPDFAGSYLFNVINAIYIIEALEHQCLCCAQHYRDKDLYESSKYYLTLYCIQHDLQNVESLHIEETDSLHDYDFLPNEYINQCIITIINTSQNKIYWLHYMFTFYIINDLKTLELCQPYLTKDLVLTYFNELECSNQTLDFFIPYLCQFKMTHLLLEYNDFISHQQFIDILNQPWDKSFILEFINIYLNGITLTHDSPLFEFIKLKLIS
jgi:hypothetical protein